MKGPSTVARRDSDRVGHWLLDRFARFPDRDAVVDPHQPMTYRQLLERIDGWSTSLTSRGLPAGSVIAVEGSASSEVCALFLALLVSGRIAVPLSSNGEDRQRALEVAHVHALFRFDPSAGWSCEPVRSSTARLSRKKLSLPA